MAGPTYEVFAIKYAERDGRRADHFVGGDPHDAPMPMDYFIWLVRNAQHQFLVDTGFNLDMAVKRKRRLLRAPREALALLGAEAKEVRQIVITHMHNDHVGTFADYPNAVFHVQDREIAYVTGRHMRHEFLRRPFEADHVAGMVRMVFEDRVAFHDGDEEIAPGVSVHRIGGHTAGLQCVRVRTRRGWVVLASDASHYYEHMEAGRCFPTTFHLGEVLEGYAKLRCLAASARHIIPGHDPLVLKRYPAVFRELEGVAVRLDTDPTQQDFPNQD